MSYQDPQENFYRKVLGDLVGKKVRRAGLTKTGNGFFIETDDHQIVIYSQIGDTFYPVDMKVRPRQAGNTRNDGASQRGR